MLPSLSGSKKSIEIQAHGTMSHQDYQLFLSGFIKIKKFDHLCLSVSAEKLQPLLLLVKKRNMMRSKSKS